MLIMLEFAGARNLHFAPCRFTTTICFLCLPLDCWPSSHWSLGA